jgi:hypothetical protein
MANRTPNHILASLLSSACSSEGLCEWCSKKKLPVGFLSKAIASRSLCDTLRHASTFSAFSPFFLGCVKKTDNSRKDSKMAASRIETPTFFPPFVVVQALDQSRKVT